jgi:hypothetical protein
MLAHYLVPETYLLKVDKTKKMSAKKNARIIGAYTMSVFKAFSRVLDPGKKPRSWRLSMTSVLN